MELMHHKKTLTFVLITLLSSVIGTGCSNQQVVSSQNEAQNQTDNKPTTSAASNLPCCRPYTPIVSVGAGTTTAKPIAPRPNIPVTAPDGRPSVQVIAARHLSNARGMFEQVRSAGYKPIIVKINDLYKVRIPYNSYEQASANIPRIATIAPDAFVAMY